MSPSLQRVPLLWKTFGLIPVTDTSPQWPWGLQTSGTDGPHYEDPGETCPGAALAHDQAILGPAPVHLQALMNGSGGWHHLPAKPCSPGQAREHCERHVFWLLRCFQYHPASSTGWEADSDAGGCPLVSWIVNRMCTCSIVCRKTWSVTVRPHTGQSCLVSSSPSTPQTSNYHTESCHLQKLSDDSFTAARWVGWVQGGAEKLCSHGVSKTICSSNWQRPKTWLWICREPRHQWPLFPSRGSVWTLWEYKYLGVYTDNRLH